MLQPPLNLHRYKENLIDNDLDNDYEQNAASENEKDLKMKMKKIKILKMNLVQNCHIIVMMTMKHLQKKLQIILCAPMIKAKVVKMFKII